MFCTNLVCCLWDLVDEGIDNVLDRLKGEAGVTGITVPLSCGPVNQLRPHAGVSPRTFRSRGGIQFQPNAEFYSGTRIRPVVAEWLRKSNPLPAVVEACEKRGLTLRASLVFCNNPAIVDRHEHCAVKDVFGDINPNWLCPVNPDVREYLRGLVNDISSSFPLQSIELRAFAFPDEFSVSDAARTGFDLGRVGLWLCSLCFCESCRQSAARDGIDAAAAARSASVTLERIFARGQPLESSVHEFLADQDLLQAFSDWRCEQITSLIESIRPSCRCRFAVHEQGGRDCGADYAAIANHCDVLVAACDPNEAVIQSAFGAALRETHDAGRIELALSACSPECPDAPTLVRAMRQAARLGIRSVQISNYGLIPLKRLEWIKEAIRYAQRETL